MSKEEKYEKITKEQVLDVLYSVAMDFIAPDSVINLVNIADHLKTSRYQVKKYMDELKEEGMVELKSTTAYKDEDSSLPYIGYTLTEKARTSEEYLKRQQENMDLIESCFGGKEIDI